FLQCRVGKRTTRAAVKIAVDMVHEGLIEKREALQRVQAQRLDDLLHPHVDPRVQTVPLNEVSKDVAAVVGQKPAVVYVENGVQTMDLAEWNALSAADRDGLIARAKFIDVAHGLPASPGAAVGQAVFDPDTAAEMGIDGRGDAVILVREETSPDDIHGMQAAQGILTERGGMSSHAALVARGFGKPCVSGCEAIAVSEEAKSFSIDGVTVQQGQILTIDGSAGAVLLGMIPSAEAELFAELDEFLRWADEARRLKVRANADNPADAAKAVELGAEGIGLCRTEHMFLDKSRLELAREMILGAHAAKTLQGAADALEKELENASGDKRTQIEARLSDARGQLEGPMGQYLGALEKILPLQQGDFEEIFRVMAGKPVTIRLIDPPMHEFLPDHDALLEDVTRLRIVAKSAAEQAELREKEALLASVNAVREQNPMLGLRGCRLGILYPEINEMQVKAIFRAAIKLKREGVEVYPEIMIPLVGFESELRYLRELLETTARREMEAAGTQLGYQFGTMIELPRAALTAAHIAETAEFFSFGTNDLTQTTLGFSRDDAEGKFLAKYLSMGLIKENPFETVDQAGVGSIMKQAIASGRATRANLKLGICGEHGGEPKSVTFFHQIGLDYVSCSPFRVPIARLAAAQAALGDGAERDR
ncbi:MAG TPA: putative PEP-binding protein, partial [Dehalococcoidia bacterium]|nr:putative PEP-binding protein [Dehalococcoidia bacterium]